MTFCSCNLDLDPVTFMYELDLDIVKMYLITKNAIFGQGFQELECNMRDRHTRPHALPAALTA